MSPVQATAPAGQETTWTAGAVARMLGVPASTVRGWHRRYQIPAGTTESGRHRRYTAADIDSLLRMKHLIGQGVSAQSAALLAFHPARGGTDTDNLLAALSQLDTDTAAALLDAHINAHGVVHAWQTVCCPALNTLGGTEATDVDHCVDLVHLLSWTITMALHRIPAPAASGPTVLLACVDGERHTLPLEALRAALAEQGAAARFLGASLPQKALQDVLRRTHTPPAALVLWAHRPTDPDIATGITTPATRLLLVGPGWPATATQADTLPAAVKVLTRF